MPRAKRFHTTEETTSGYAAPLWLLLLLLMLMVFLPWCDLGHGQRGEEGWLAHDAAVCATLSGSVSRFHWSQRRTAGFREQTA